jgi:hypothetical protein
VARTHSSKLDELIRLSHAREGQIGALTDEVEKLRFVVAEQAKAIEAMKPTVDQVAAVFVFGRVGGVVWRVSFRVAVVIVPILWWMNDKWHLFGQLFKRP